jgi:hypothetical protein
LSLFYGGCASSAPRSPATTSASVAPTAANAAVSPETARPPQAIVKFAPPPPEFGTFKELYSRFPTMKLAIDWIKADIVQRYAPLIAFQTQLTDAQHEQLLMLLAECYKARLEFAANGNPSIPPEAKAMVTDFNYNRLAQLIGNDNAAWFKRSEAEPVTWDRVERLDRRLRYEATPLNQQQFAALWPILSEEVYCCQPPMTSAEADTLVQQRRDCNRKALAQAGAQLTSVQTKTLSRLLDDDLVLWRVQLYTMTKAQQALAVQDQGKGGTSQLLTEAPTASR